MSIDVAVNNRIGFINLNRPKALNSLSLDMIRAITQTLLLWKDDTDITSVVIQSAHEKGFCAGGDIRFFYTAGQASPQQGSALLEDFFTEEYALNYLIHHYPKPYIAVMDGVVMGGGMGLAQSIATSRIGIVTECTRMAMPEVNIGIFPDVGGSYFLSRVPGKIGIYLGITGDTIGAADALHANLADVFIPSVELPALRDFLSSNAFDDIHAAIREFAAPFTAQIESVESTLMTERDTIDRHFSCTSVPDIMQSLEHDSSLFARSALALMRTRSPLMMCVTLEQIRRGTLMTIADCLRMERSMIRHCFERGEAFEGIRAMVIDKDNAPKWMPASLDDVTPEMVSAFFVPAWPAYVHPLRDLG
ncbi:MAG TPA: enoyl-CoA hydratase/isomerase family protein [Burkholderiaceae bacterium]|jgi:enoyl-CoA hydratase/carnithine racemase